MSISSETRKVGPFIGNGVTTAFPFTFKVFVAADLDVVQLDTATTVETILVLITNYTVTLNADQNSSPGGTVTLLVALAVGQNLVITSSIELLQPTDITNQGGFFPSVINDSLDRVTILTQQLKVDTDRSFKVPLTSSSGALTFGAGVVTWMATPSSANLRAALTDETGVGAAVFAGSPALATPTLTSPTLIAPVLGIPASGTLTNCTGTAAGLTAGNVTTNANLTGDVTSVGNATTLTNAPVIAKVLTGYTSGAGTVAATDSILQAIQKLNGNDSTNANLTGPITSVGNATAVAAQTGTGSTFVMQASPALTTPNIGTPSAGVLTNCTGTASGLTAGNVTTNANLTGDVTSVGNAATVVTNANLTGHVTSVGNAAVLGSFTSLQLATALTNETGSGSAVFATSPVLTTPDLGTPSALVGTNITGTATAFTASNVTTNANLTGHVTSVGNAAVLGSFTSAQLATALTDETGTGLAVFATSPQFTTPLLGTPTSGTLTNCTGLPVAGGGTGSATAAAAKIALEVVSSATGSEIIPAGTTAQRDAAPATGYLRFNTSNVAFEGYTGAAWSSIGGGGAAISNDTATATDIYPLFAAATTGTPTNIYTSNAKLLYKPSTGEFKANAPVALNGLVMNATAVATSYTIETGYNAHSVGPVTIGGGVVITISSGQRWLVS